MITAWRRDARPAPPGFSNFKTKDFLSNWIAITPANLNNAKVSALVDALRMAALGNNQTDRAPEIIQAVVDRIRTEVKGCKNNILDSDPTKIPKSLKAIAVRMMLWDLKNALEFEVTEAEKIDHGNDENFLKRVASCEIPVNLADNPETVEEVQPGAAQPSFGDGRRRQFTRGQQDGR